MFCIESVKDTRSVDLMTLKPIPGSGDSKSCDHCGKTHEVHVTVFDSANLIRLVVGTTCAKKMGAVGDGISSKELQESAAMREIKRIAQAIFNSVDKSRSKQEIQSYVSSKARLFAEMTDNVLNASRIEMEVYEIWN